MTSTTVIRNASWVVAWDHARQGHVYRRDIDVAFMPMNLPVDRMRPRPVAECVKTFQPKVVYLNHYNQTYASWLGNRRGDPPPDAQNTPATIEAFQAAIEGASIEFRDGGWYPAAPTP